MIVATHHDSDAGRDVVGDDGHVVDGRPVGAEDDEVLDVLVRECDALVHEVIPLRRAVGNAEAQHERNACSDAALNLVRRQSVAAPVVLERLAARFGITSPLIELGGRAEAPIHSAGVEQSLTICAMPREVRALIGDVLVPVETEPLHSLENRARALVGAAGAVGVLDAEQERSTMLAGEQPIVDRCASAADVEIAGGRWREAESQRRRQ